MNTNELDAIRRRIDSATDGPWEVSGQRVVRRHPNFPGPGGAEVVEPILSDAGESAANLALAAHAREDVPALLDEVDRLAAIVDRVRGVAEEWETSSARPIASAALDWQSRHAAQLRAAIERTDS